MRLKNRTRPLILVGIGSTIPATLPKITLFRR